MIIRPLTLALGVSFAAAVSAQSPAPSAPPVAKEVSAPSPMTTDGRPSGSDPRVCLEFSTRDQVIACAERYRPRRPAAKA